MRGTHDKIEVRHRLALRAWSLPPFFVLFPVQLKMVLIKCCDISNEVRPMNISEPWVDCLLEEYFMQSDREKAEGLPVAPFMDRFVFLDVCLKS